MKRKLLGIFMGTALVFSLAACGGGDNAADEPAGDNGGATTANAEEIFKQNCSACHGADLSGGAGPNLTKVGSKYDEAQIKDIITNGKGAMRAGIIDGEEKDAVASWLAGKK